MHEILSLQDWAKEYARHRYRSRGTAFEFTQQTGMAFVIKTATKTEGYIIVDNLAQAKIPDSDMNVVLVTKNTQANAQALAEHWKTFSASAKLWIIFANPASSNDKYWSINPYLHSQIADEATLKTGLLSMAGSVEWVN